MNIKLLILSIIIFLYFVLGFEEISYSLNKVNPVDISELQILKYLPTDNKIFLISNSKSSKIINDIKKKYEAKDQNKLNLMKDSILAYLGIDLGSNKLEDIYNDELTITTYENEKKDIDDILIIFKIKEKKDIDDILNLTNKVDEPDKLIKISRENKLNYLKYIYRTNDGYILTSSNKKLIIDALQTKNITKKIGTNYIKLKELLKNFKNENNVLITKDFKVNQLLNDEDYSLIKDNYLATIFESKDKKYILKSYLLNNKKNLDIMSYKKIVKEDTINSKKYQISIYNDLLNTYDFLDNIQVNSFEKAFFKELNDKLKQNILFLISDKNWIIIYDNSNLSIENIRLLKDFNKYSLEKNNNIFTIYSKNILKQEKDIIKQSNYKNIFSAQSDNLTFISNSLIKEEDIELISKEFTNNKGDSYGKYFLNKKINLKNTHYIQPKEVAYIENINFFFKNIINVSIKEFKSVIKQSIPETTPIYYAETNLKIF